MVVTKTCLIKVQSANTILTNTCNEIQKNGNCLVQGFDKDLKETVVWYNCGSTLLCQDIYIAEQVYLQMQRTIYIGSKDAS